MQTACERSWGTGGAVVVRRWTMRELLVVQKSVTQSQTMKPTIPATMTARQELSAAQMQKACRRGSTVASDISTKSPSIHIAMAVNDSRIWRSLDISGGLSKRRYCGDRRRRIPELPGVRIAVRPLGDPRFEDQRVAVDRVLMCALDTISD